MQKISILKVEDPSCLWGRLVRSTGGAEETMDQYDRLQTQMNLFYHDVTQDLRKLRPTSLEEGQVCAVYWSVLKSWCRAVVESTIMDSVSCQARCRLVDHGELLIVPSDQIRVAPQTFLQLPFWVRRFHLARIKPATLRVSLSEEKAELIPAAQWDSSATLYLHNLLQVSTRAEAVLLDSEADSTSIELYLAVRNIKICLNDELVAKKFAFYVKEPAGGLDEVDQFPVMLSSSLLTQTVCTGPTNQAPQIHPLHAKHTVMSHCSPSAAGAGDWLMALCTPQVTGKPQSPGGEQHSGSAATDSDSSEDTDSSLAAALTKNLRLFRFLKFLNPSSSSSSHQHAAPALSQHEDPSGPEQLTAACSTCTGQEVWNSSHTGDRQASVGPSGAERPESSWAQRPADEEPSWSGSAEAEKTYRSKEDWACSRLLQWLNPEPLSADPDAADEAPANGPQVDLRTDGVLLHSAFPVEPCSGLDDAPVTDAMRRLLRRKQYNTLSAAERYSWPAVARGSNTVIVSHNAEQPLSYLPPLLSHVLLNSIFTSLTSSTGPIVVLLCPGWEKVHAVFDLLEEMKISSTLHPAAVLVGVGKDEAEAVRIPKNCLLLVTTPFSLARLLSCRCFLFLRLYHLVLDEADRLFSLAPDQMATILQHFQKVTSSEEKTSCPQQLVAVAKRWSSHMEGLLANHMPCPCIVMTVPEEAALYGNVQQIILVALESSKLSVLLGALDFHPDVGQKTLIVTSSAQEVEDVFKAVSNKSAFCLRSHEGLNHEFDFVIQQWRKDIGPGTHVILVTTNECLKCFGIRDATCVVHYGFPASPKVFGSRLFCLAESFRNLSERVPSQDHVCRSVLLISERNVRHVVGVLRYLMRTSAPLPPELLSFAQGVHAAREDQKTSRPLCSYLKSFGVCRDASVCPDRHTVVSHLDQSELPATGVIEVVPLHIKTPSVFYGRIVRKDDGGFSSMASEMSRYYGDRRPAATEVLEGGLYAVEDQEHQVFHRVKVLWVSDRGDRLFFSVLARFIDVGKEEEVKSHQLLQLPERFHLLPGQAVEIIVCRVKPVDAEADWHPKVTRAISQKIRGLQHRARAVLSLGNTVFVDPMVRLMQVPGMKTVINEYNVQSEILNTGMGVTNPEHVDLLRRLCHEGESGGTEEGHLSRSGDGPASLKAQEDVLVEAFRAAEVSRLADAPQLEPCEQPSPGSSVTQFLVPAAPAPPTAGPRLVPVCDWKSPPSCQAASEQRIDFTADLRSAEQTMRTKDGERGSTSSRAAAAKATSTTGATTTTTTTTGPCENGDDQTIIHLVVSADETDCPSTKRFHPNVRWYQTADVVMVTVKLRNPEAQRCLFHPDRVDYSGSVDGRAYRAQLDLQAPIAAERCCWEMKSNEPVLTLVKEQRGYWERLVRNKNIFVSFDMEHFEEDEDRTPNGVWFEANTGEEDSYVNSESESD